MINNSSNNVNIQAYEQKLFEHFFNNSHTKTAQNPKGYLVHENPIEAVGSSVADLGKDVVNLTKALKDGDSNDASLGRMNDLGLKIGALGIASYLLTRKSSPKAKLMEFAGAGVFLAMMQMWQKIFIAAPIKARFGVDINQKYVDSLGRKKDLLLDNQYIPDLETNEELDKLADNLKLPKDMEYRREYAKELRRKIGLQGRTLNMLTVGVATPVLTALICNRIEKYADGAIVEHGLKTAERKAKDFAQNVNRKTANPLFDRQTGSKIIKEFSKGDRNVDDAFFTRLADAFNPLNAVEGGKLSAEIADMTPQIKADLEKLFASSIDEKTASSDIFNLFASNAKDEGDFLVIKAKDGLTADVSDVKIAKSKLKQALEETMLGVKEGRVEYTPDGILEALKNNGNMSVEKTLTDAISGAEFKRQLTAIPYEFLDDKTGVFKGFIQDGKKKSIPSFMQKVQENYKYARQISASVASVEDVVKSLDNAFGKEYFNIVDSIFAIAKPDTKTLDLMRSDSEFAAKYLQDAIKDIASDSSKYDQLLKKLAKAPAVSEARRSEIINNLISNTRGTLSTISLQVAPELETLTKMSAYGAGNFATDVLGYMMRAFPGIDSTKNRIFLAADLEKRIQDGTLKKQWEMLQSKGAVTESFETLVDDCRRILLKSTPGDFANTNLINGNGEYYKRLNDILFNQPLSPATKKVIASTRGLSQSIDEMRGALMAIGSRGFGSKALVGERVSVADYVNSANVLIKDNNGVITLCDEIKVNNDIIRKAFEETIGQSDAIKYQKVGKSLKDFAFENASQKYNSKTWMRIFLPIAGILAGVTLLAQVAIGKKNKDQHLYMEKQQHLGAANGNRQ